MPIPLPSFRCAAITVPSSIPQFPHGQSLINSSSFLFLNNSTLSQTNGCAITMFPALPMVRFSVLFRVNLAEIFTPLPLKHSGLATLTLHIVSVSLPFAILAGHAALILLCITAVLNSCQCPNWSGDKPSSAPFFSIPVAVSCHGF